MAPQLASNLLEVIQLNHRIILASPEPTGMKAGTAKMAGVSACHSEKLKTTESV